MKGLLKALKWAGLSIVAVVAILIVYILLRADRTFDAPFPDIVAVTDSATLAHGRQLVLGPAHCADCHANTADLARAKAGEEVPFGGGFDFVFPLGTVRTPNISSDVETGIGGYSDGEIARTIRYGVKRNGQALVDFMPFYDMSDRDVTAIVSYLRTVEPVSNRRPEHEWSFMGKAVRAFGLIKPMGDGDVPPAPEPDSTAEYGRYLAVNVANCRGCHTVRDLLTGGFVGDDFAGQMVFEENDGTWFVSPNLTPDPETGRLTYWNLATFKARFRRGAVFPGSPMPWGPFSRMSDVELTALYKFFQSLEPVTATVETPVGPQTGEPPAG